MEDRDEERGNKDLRHKSHQELQYTSTYVTHVAIHVVVCAHTIVKTSR